MSRRDRKDRNRRFIKPFERGFGVLWNRAGHRLRACGIGALALLGCWVTLLPGYVWIVESPHAIGGAARWAAAAAIDAVGLHDWRWSVDTKGGRQRWRVAYIRQDAWHRAQADAVLASGRGGLLAATGGTLLLGGLGAFLIRRKGLEIETGKIIRGRRMASDEALARTLRSENVASELAIGGVPLIKDMEPYNTLLVGAQGTGKTSATEALLEGIAERGEPMVIYDYGPALLPRFFNADRGDIILNPLDERSEIWSPWSEIKDSADCAAIAEGFIPERDQAQPFWGDAGRLLFADVLHRMGDDSDRSVAKLLFTLLRMNQDEIRAILEGTNAAKLYEEGAERTGRSVEIHASVYIKALGQLQAHAGGKNDFSITRYIRSLDDPAPANGRPWLWLTTDPRSAPTLRPLLSCWTNAVATAFLSLPERLDRRLWFALDELATLHELPSLPSFMQNARKRGGCALITLQTPSQLRAIYKEADARTILNGCQTQAVFRLSDAEGAEWASRELGSAEVEELQESTRLHAGGHRGHEVNLSMNRRIKPLALPAEIMMTPNCQCYVKLPADRPIVMTEVTPRTPLSRAEPIPAFVKRVDDGKTAEAALERMREEEKAKAAKKQAGAPGKTPPPPKDEPNAPNKTAKPAVGSDEAGELRVIKGGKEDSGEKADKPAASKAGKRKNPEAGETSARPDKAHPDQTALAFPDPPGRKPTDPGTPVSTTGWSE